MDSLPRAVGAAAPWLLSDDRRISSGRRRRNGDLRRGIVISDSERDLLAIMIEMAMRSAGC